MTHIISFSAKNLNDHYTYEKNPIRHINDDLIVLYGDNGAGKTTILNLIFHMLSDLPKNGHLNAINLIPFSIFEIELSTGSVIKASRKNGTREFPINFRITHKDQSSVEYNFIPERERDQYFQKIFESEMINIWDKQKMSRSKYMETLHKVIQSKNVAIKNSDEVAHKRYLKEISLMNIKTFFIAADRRVRSNLLNDREIQQIEVNSRDDAIQKIRSLYLREALSSASKYVNKKIIEAANIGIKDTNTLFIDLIKKIEAYPNTTTNQEDFAPILYELTKIKSEILEFSDLNIVPDFGIESIILLINNYYYTENKAITAIVNHQVSNIRAQINAIKPIAIAVRTLLELVNELFHHKNLLFSPLNGFSIYGFDNQLDVAQLSSGEQHLLLIFIHLLTANDYNSIFIIDEPEISLNVKWQRKMIEGMQKITSLSKTQIVIATHSIELLSEVYDSVIALDPKIS